MRVQPLTPHDTDVWAALLAVCFQRDPADMVALLGWLHQLGTVVAWGAWDRKQLAAQYMALVRPVQGPEETFHVGMSINMAVHPDCRGRGLVKQVAGPVYEQVRDCNGAFGLGFSNAEGVRVDRNSKSYGYQVVGQLTPWVGPLSRGRGETLTLTDDFPALTAFTTETTPSARFGFPRTPEALYRRYAVHPFRDYRYGIWREGERVRGVVVYREIQVAGVRGAALLDTWGDDLAALLARWTATVRRSGARFVQTLTTPESRIEQALRASVPLVRQPITRNPYYLTIKPLTATLPAGYDTLAGWDVVGGDVL